MTKVFEMIVFDCNAAVEMARGTEYGNALACLIGDDEKSIAPCFFTYELANVMGKYLRGGRVGRSDSLRLGRTASGLVDEFQEEDGWEEVMLESVKLDHSAYDLFYYLLAQRNGATLFTLDKKLQNLCLSNGIDCVYLDRDFGRR